MKEGSVEWSAPGLDRLARDLLVASEECAVLITEALEKGGKLVEGRAKEHAAASGSTSIPGTIWGARARLGYDVHAGGESSPIAGLWEYGNRGSSPQSPTFSHPVYGNYNAIVDQPRHPFLAPALKESMGEIETFLEEAVEVALRAPGGAI